MSREAFLFGLGSRNLFAKLTYETGRGSDFA